MACLEDDDVYDVANEWKSQYTITLDEEQRKQTSRYITKDVFLENIEWEVCLCFTGISIKMLSHLPNSMCSITMDVEFVGELSSKIEKLEFDGFSKEKTFKINQSQTLKIGLSVTNVKGVFFVPLFDYSKVFTDDSNVVFLIGDKKVRANKQLLSLHSPVFYAMFNSEFSEKNQEEIELKDVDVSAFLEVLRILNPQRAKPRERGYFSNYSNLLGLADRYQIQSVVDYCEKQIMEDIRVFDSTFCHSLTFASKYGMHQRMKQIISLMEFGERGIRNFLDQDEFKTLPNDLKLFVYSNLPLF